MSPSMEKERIDHQVLNPLFSGTESHRDTLAEYQIRLAAFFCISVSQRVDRGVRKHPEKLWVKIPNYFCLSTYHADARIRHYSGGDCRAWLSVYCRCPRLGRDQSAWLHRETSLALRRA